MINDTLPFTEKSLLFAPMEGITDPLYRKAVMKLYPEWDRFSTDFLRIPGNGHYSEKKIIEHVGREIFNNSELMGKTTFQILTSAKANIEHTVKQIEGLGITHLDLNLGCPSRKVNSHGGGSFLLSNLEELKVVLEKIRRNFPHRFTVKMRIGYRNDELFEQSLKLIEDQGADAVILHARTRDQLYKGIADWSYIKKAVEILNIPLIGNGDVWNTQDIDRLYEQSNCHSIMVARGAMKTPWLAKVKKHNLNDSLALRLELLPEYFFELKNVYSEAGWSEDQILKRYKALSRYLFDDFPDHEEMKKKFMRSKALKEFETYLTHIS